MVERVAYGARRHGRDVGEPPGYRPGPRRARQVGRVRTTTRSSAPHVASSTRYVPACGWSASGRSKTATPSATESRSRWEAEPLVAGRTVLSVVRPPVLTILPVTPPARTPRGVHYHHHAPAPALPAGRLARPGDPPRCRPL